MNNNVFNALFSKILLNEVERVYEINESDVLKSLAQDFGKILKIQKEKC